MQARTAPWFLVLSLALAAPLAAQPHADDASGGFRHFPGGKVVPNLRGESPAANAAALRADADAQLPDGFRLRDDVDPLVSPVASNTLYRFGLAYHGVRLASDVDYVAIVGRNGRLLSSRVRNVPRSVDGTVATVDASAALAAAAGHARATLGQAGALSTSTPVLEIWVDEQRAGRLCWEILVREDAAGTVRASTRYHVAAIDTPAVLAWADDIRYETIHAQADVWTLSPNQPAIVAPLSDLPIFVNGAPAGPTGENGSLVVPVLPAGSSVGGQLLGPLAVVRSAGAVMNTSTITAGGDTTLHFAAVTEFTLAQTTAFRWTTFANRWVRARLPFLNGGSFLNGFRVFVNENIPCNAFSTGDSTHFGRAAGGCNNTATPTVLVHEFGHSLHALLRGDRFDEAYSEGFGDALAGLVTEQPCVGPGFVTSSDVCARDATDVTTWPVGTTEPHEVGRVYAQFVWALTQSLGFDVASELVLGAATAGPNDIPDAVHLSFVADDDDGLLGTCSPHQHALEAAADSRRLPRPQTCRPAGDNQGPTAHDDVVTLVEDELGIVDLLANDTDPDGDQLVVTSVQPGTLGTFDCQSRPCTFRPTPEASGTESLVYTVVDTFGGESTATVHLQISAVDDPIFVSGPNDQLGLEHDPIPLLATIVDPDGPAFTFRWFAGSPSSAAPCTFTPTTAASTTMTCTHEGTFPFGVVVQQGGSSEQVYTFGNAVIINAVPSVTIAAPGAGAAFPEQTSVSVAATFDDGPTPGPHTCEIAWGDGTVAAGAVGAGTCTGAHVYAAGSAGVRQIVVTVQDPGLARGSASVSIEITAATGAPCVRRPGRACVAAGLGIVGRTRPVAFEFAAWQRDGRGGGQLVLLDGRWLFTAIAVRSVTIDGTDAVFSGAGSYNGRPGYTFEAAVADNRRPLRPRGAPDTIRVVIRDGAGRVVQTVEGEVLLGDVTVN